MHKTLQTLSPTAFAINPIRAICEVGRRFHDDRNDQFRHFGSARSFGYGLSRDGPGFFLALGAYRATVAHQVALLTPNYDLDVEGDLASILPTAGGED